MNVNRKWGIFPINMPKCYKIFIAKKCLYSQREDLPENLDINIAQECKRSTSGWRVSLKNVFAYACYY